MGDNSYQALALGLLSLVCFVVNHAQFQRYLEHVTRAPEPGTFAIFACR